jgi:hypothetical protein
MGIPIVVLVVAGDHRVPYTFIGRRSRPGAKRTSDDVSGDG